MFPGEELSQEERIQLLEALLDEMQTRVEDAITYLKDHHYGIANTVSSWEYLRSYAEQVKERSNETEIPF